MLHNAVNKGGESTSITESAVPNFVKDGSESWIELILAVQVAVTKVIDVFGQISEEEDVVLANLAGDFNLDAC